MAKRKTRKQKENTHYSFTISWDPKSSSSSASKSVKGQKNHTRTRNYNGNTSKKDANFSAQDGHWQEIRKNLIKTLGITTFILSLELVLYLFLN